jgi:uncharacterized protein YvpB
VINYIFIALVKIMSVIFMSALTSSFLQSRESSSCEGVQKIKVPSNVKLNVVYIPQNDMKSCATTSVAMVISYYEHLQEPLDKEVVWHISGTDEAVISQYGNDMEGLQRISTHYGYQSQYMEHMEISDIKKFLADGVPLVLNITVSKQSSATHAVLVIGYDDYKKLFYINDPANIKTRALTYSDLEDRWSAYLSSPRGMSYRSVFVIYPKKH